MNPAKILITGGCGFIGLNLIQFLMDKGFRNLRILDNLSIGTQENLESLLSGLGTFSTKQGKDHMIYSLHSSVNPRVELFIGDIRNKEACIKATEGMDAVVHLAAHAAVIPSIENPFFDFETNALGTLNLLHAAQNNKVDTFIFASSVAPLGEHDPPLNERNPVQPLSPYAASKLACEGYCSAFHGSYGLNTVILRFSNVYGPYCLNKQSVIAKFIKDGISKKELTIYGDGSQTRDFIHVDDLCQAISLCFLGLENKRLTNQQITNNGKISGETFHLGTGTETSILELAQLIQGFFHKEITISCSPERKGEIKRSYSDITKAQTILGFSPQISLKQGVREVCEWLKTRNVADVKNAHILSGSE